MNRLTVSSLLKVPFSKLNKQISVAYSMLDKPPTVNLEPDPIIIEDKPLRQQQISTAMKHYLQVVREYKSFMKERETEFDIGKRHLANMMGRDPESFTQQDIDESIEYLFPCGLHEKYAKPKMKPPEEIFPRKREAFFDYHGRPNHCLFYTQKQSFYQLMHDLVNVFKDLNKFEDDVLRGKDSGDAYNPVDLHSLKWISKEKLRSMFQEQITDAEHRQFTALLQRIADHPYGSKVEDTTYKYTELIIEMIHPLVIKAPELLPDGRSLYRHEECTKKHASANVDVIYPGTGKFSINGQDIHYFRRIQCREQVLFPLIFTKMLNKVDVVVAITAGNGDSSQAGAIRLGISRGLGQIVTDEMREKMRLAGLLQQDLRMKERKLYGQRGAREKFKWRKR